MNGSRKISLVLADVDGTLVTQEKILTERATRAVWYLRERGIRFAVTSGRPPRGMQMINEALHLDTPIAGFNGGVFIEPDGKVISSRQFRGKPRGKRSRSSGSINSWRGFTRRRIGTCPIRRVLMSHAKRGR